MLIVHAGVTYRPGMYAFHSTHTCSTSNNISSNWHDNILRSFCYYMLKTICWSACAWLRMLLVHTDSAPRSHGSLKFLLVAILVLNLAHTLHRSLVTISFLPLSSMSQSSHLTVRHSRSISVFHFWYVAYTTFLFLGYGTDASLELWTLFMLHALLQLTTT